MTIIQHKGGIRFTGNNKQEKTERPHVFHQTNIKCFKIKVFNFNAEEVFLALNNALSLKSISIIIKSFASTIARFPLPVLAGILSFIFLVIEIHFRNNGDEVVHDFRFLKLFLECMSAISFYIAFDIFAESQQLGKSIRLGLYLLGFCILGMHYFSITPGMFDSETIFVSRYLIFLVCFHLMVSFLAFSKSSEINSFWQYNYFLLKRIVTSLLYSVTLFLGLGSAMWALDKLFNIHFNPDYYTDLGAFILLIFNTVFFLKGMPASYDSFNKTVEFKKSVRLFVQYVLMPIIAIYITLLYLYMFKIVVNKQLPDGWVCIPILIFSILGILAYLLIYPIRLNSTNRLIYLFSKNFFYILLPLLTLYFIAIMKRIMPYGITEDRYLVFMLGVWIVIISIYIILSKVDNIIIIPISLFLLLAISAIGPWGMFQLSVANQILRLEHLLKRNHLLENGKLVRLDKRYRVPKNDASSIRSIFSYLNKRGEINAIHPWLGEEDQVKLDSAIAKNKLVYIHSIFSDLGPEDETPYELHHYFTAPGNTLLNTSFSVEGYKKITQFDCSNNDYPSGEKESTRIISQLQHNNLSFQFGKDSVITIPLGEKFRSLLHYYQTRDSIRIREIHASNTLKVIGESSQTIDIPGDSMIIYFENKKIVLSMMEFIKADTSYRLHRVHGFLLN